MAGNKLRIGVLALQGDYREHLGMLNKCGARGVAIKNPTGFLDIDGLIIPGGESTTIGKLMDLYELREPLKMMAEEGLPMFGTCAGLVLMGKEVVGEGRTPLGIMDTLVERNAFGRQVDSFETDLSVEGVADQDHPFRAVFIRAPLVQSVGDGGRVLARVGRYIVMVRQGKFLACAFHPELTDDIRIHDYFLDIVRDGVA